MGLVRFGEPPYSYGMSSDLFDVRVKSVNDREVVFDILTTGAGGLDDLAKSPSFALVLLSHALRRAAEDSATTQERERLRKRHDASPLHRELETADEDWYVSASWMQRNVKRFIASCEVVERRNNIGEDELQRREDEIVEEFGGSLDDDRQREWKPRRWERCHNYTLRVTVADSRWLEHMEPGLEFGSTAFDV